MGEYVITTDSTADLFLSYIEEHHLPCIGLNFLVDDQEYSYRDNYDMKNYYDRMRDGMKTSTMQAGMQEVTDLFTALARDGKDIVHISFSSGLSGSFNTESLVAQQVMEEYPERRIVVLDSLAASGGQGLIVRKALEKKEAGADMDELIRFVEEIKLKTVHYFTVEDMVYLYRGGRVSKVKSILANAINIKPILHVDNDGHLVMIDKARGRKKSLQKMADHMAANKTEDFSKRNPYIVICHADCEADARYLGTQVQAHFPDVEILYEEIGPTIGAHSGPGTIALFYIGEAR